MSEPVTAEEMETWAAVNERHGQNLTARYLRAGAAAIRDRDEALRRLREAEQDHDELSAERERISNLLIAEEELSLKLQADRDAALRRLAEYVPVSPMEVIVDPVFPAEPEA